MTKKFEVLEPVIRLVAISVMEVRTLGDWLSSLKPPHDVVAERVSICIASRVVGPVDEDAAAIVEMPIIPSLGYPRFSLACEPSINRISLHPIKLITLS